VHHDISLTRLSDGAVIHCESLSISIDVDSWAWSWSGTLLGRDALDAVIPAGDGAPVVLVATVDGYVWHLLAEDWSEEREFAKRAISVSGRGLTAYLAAPYELPVSGTLLNARTVNQAVEDLLPGGWTVSWHATAPDWVLPVGSWSWQGQTVISAIHDALRSAGFTLVPAMAAQSFVVKPRYPVLPWDFAGATPDLAVPADAIMKISSRRRVESQANAVFVHGGDTGGIIARVYRAQTAGDRVADTQSSQLITHADGARLLGSRILAANERQPDVRSIEIPLGGPDFPLAEVGQLIAISDGQSTIRGIVNAVNVNVTPMPKPKLRQTITIGEESPNTWARFARILPKNPMLIGEVTIAHADGTVSVELAGGGVTRVRGQGQQVGDAVYVQGARVVDAAPSLPSVDIDV
jgi:hypothetical protein